MRRSPARFVVLLCLAGLTLVGSPSAGAASTTTTVTLPLHTFFQMVVDPNSHQVFVDGGPNDSSGTIVVLAADGSVEGSITGESDASGMVVDGSTLYVARCGQGEIDEIDTATLENVGSIPASVGGSCYLGLAGGRLWYPTTGGFTPIDSVTIAGPHTVATDQIPGNVYEPMFLSVPSNPNVLWVGNTSLSTPTVWQVDVSQATPTVVNTALLTGDSFLRDWAISPDGQTLYLASASPTELTSLHTSDLSSAGIYQTGPSPAAVDLSPSGNRLVGGTYSSTPNLNEFNLGNATPILTANTSDATALATPPGGVRFSEDGSLIFSVTESGSIVELHVIGAQPLSSMTISDGGLKTSLVGSTVRLTGNLDLPGGNPSGQKVNITATTPTGSTRAVGQATANGNGNWGITTPALTPGGEWTFHATYPGGTYAGSTAAVGLRIGDPEPLLTVTAGTSTVSYGSGVVLTVHLGKWHTNRNVTLYRSMDGSTPVKIAGGTVSSRGTKTFTVHPSRRSVYTARYAGDSTYFAKTSAARVVYVRARLSVTQSGYYRTSGSVHLYHYHSGCWTNDTLCPHFASHLAPGMSAGPVRFTLQKLISGRWVTALAGSAGTSSTGVAGVIYRYTGTGLMGHLMRVHAAWPGTKDYLGATSPWVEFELTK